MWLWIRRHLRMKYQYPQQYCYSGPSLAQDPQAGSAPGSRCSGTRPPHLWAGCSSTSWINKPVRPTRQGCVVNIPNGQVRNKQWPEAGLGIESLSTSAVFCIQGLHGVDPTFSAPKTMKNVLLEIVKDLDEKWSLLRGNEGSWQTFSSWASKSLQMVTAAMKLKDTCFLEEKLWQT